MVFLGKEVINLKFFNIRREDKFLGGGYGGDRYAFRNSLSANYALIS